MVVNSCYFLVVVLVCFPSLCFADVCGEISVACVLWVQLASLGWDFLSSTSVGLDLWVGIFKSSFVMEYLVFSNIMMGTPTETVYLSSWELTNSRCTGKETA